MHCSKLLILLLTSSLFTTLLREIIIYSRNMEFCIFHQRHCLEIWDPCLGDSAPCTILFSKFINYILKRNMLLLRISDACSNAPRSGTH